MHKTLQADTGIFTLWFSCNYGAILTTFALYRLLEQEGLHPVALDQEALDGKTRWQDSDNISRAFMARHGICCGNPLRSDSDLQELNEQLATFIVGSDQVWRWQYTQAYGLLHFLDFVRGDKRKIAISSSFGIDKEERPEDMVRKAGYFLRSFDAVSVREKSGIELLRRHYGVEGDWVLDPVFLCGTACYDELLKGTTVPPKPYLLSYVLEPNAVIRHHIETIAAERGLEVINMVDAQKEFEQQKARFGGIGNISQGVSPEQWVTYIRHCAYFVTDSFHGVCFAHLYHRPFLCVAPPERGLTRFTSLLAHTGLERCLLSSDYTEAEWKAATAPIDWECIQARLDMSIQESRKWIQRALTTPRDECAAARAQIVYELLYAGSGIPMRYYKYEKAMQQSLETYRTHFLSWMVRIKYMALWVFSLCPFSRLRRRAHFYRQKQKEYYLYLKRLGF